MTAIWIDDDDCDFPFDSDRIGFLVKIDPLYAGMGGTTYRLQLRPLHGSDGPVLSEHAGTIDNVGRYGCGLARVARRAHNGRLCLARVPAAPGLLDELGYPELAAELGAVESESELRDRWAAMLADMGIRLVGASGTLRGRRLNRAYAATVAMIGGAS